MMAYHWFGAFVGDDVVGSTRSLRKHVINYVDAVVFIFTLYRKRSARAAYPPDNPRIPIHHKHSCQRNSTQRQPMVRAGHGMSKILLRYILMKVMKDKTFRPNWLTGH